MTSDMIPKQLAEAAMVERELARIVVAIGSATRAATFEFFMAMAREELGQARELGSMLARGEITEAQREAAMARLRQRTDAAFESAGRYAGSCVERIGTQLAAAVESGGLTESKGSSQEGNSP
jgi:hypothetical protein